VIVNYFADEFKKEQGIDVTSDNAACSGCAMRLKSQN